MEICVFACRPLPLLPTPLKHKLKIIQNICLRLMLGARNTTPIRSMEVEANIAPLDSRQDFLLAKLFCKLCYRPLWNFSSRNRVTPVSIQDGVQHGITFAAISTIPAGPSPISAQLSPISAELSPIPAALSRSLRRCRDP